MIYSETRVLDHSLFLRLEIEKRSPFVVQFPVTIPSAKIKELPGAPDLIRINSAMIYLSDDREAHVIPPIVKEVTPEENNALLRDWFDNWERLQREGITPKQIFNYINDRLVALISLSGGYLPGKNISVENEDFVQYNMHPTVYVEYDVEGQRLHRCLNPSRELASSISEKGIMCIGEMFGSSCGLENHGIRQAKGYVYYDHQSQSFFYLNNPLDQDSSSVHPDPRKMLSEGDLLLVRSLLGAMVMLNPEFHLHSLVVDGKNSFGLKRIIREKQDIGYTQYGLNGIMLIQQIDSLLGRNISTENHDTIATFPVEEYPLIIYPNESCLVRSKEPIPIDPIGSFFQNSLHK